MIVLDRDDINNLTALIARYIHELVIFEGLAWPGSRWPNEFQLELDQIPDANCDLAGTEWGFTLIAARAYAQEQQALFELGLAARQLPWGAASTPEECVERVSELHFVLQNLAQASGALGPERPERCQLARPPNPEPITRTRAFRSSGEASFAMASRICALLGQPGRGSIFAAADSSTSFGPRPRTSGWGASGRGRGGE